MKAASWMYDHTDTRELILSSSWFFQEKLPHEYKIFFPSAMYKFPVVLPHENSEHSGYTLLYTPFSLISPQKIVLALYHNTMRDGE